MSSLRSQLQIHPISKKVKHYKNAQEQSAAAPPAAAASLTAIADYTNAAAGSVYHLVA
jgi:hypothetical protein